MSENSNDPVAGTYRASWSQLNGTGQVIISNNDLKLVENKSVDLDTFYAKQNKNITGDVFDGPAKFGWGTLMLTFILTIPFGAYQAYRNIMASLVIAF